jgi:hypothetical protein
MAVDINISGQYLQNGVPIGGGSANPSVITASYVDGTIVTGTTVETSACSLLIPANTFTTNGMLEIVGRIQKTGIAGNLTYRWYKNTSNTLTGATLIASIMAPSGQIYSQGQRTFRINSNVLTGLNIANTVTTDTISGTNAEVSTTFTTSVDNYILLAVTNTSLTDSTVVRMARAVKYI